MTATPKKHAAPHAAARQLEDILKWKIQPFTPRPTLSAVRYDRAPIKNTDETLLPFPTDAVTTDGARGVATAAGADQWIELWASRLAWALDTATAKADGPWLLKTLHEHPDLHPLPDPKTFEDNPELQQWAETFLYEWDQFTQELTRLWWRLATLTGNAPKRRGLCPKCRTGWLTSQPGTKGFSDEATCSNPKCRICVDYSKEEIATSFRAAMRTVEEDDDQWVSSQQARVVWPALPASTLRRWVHEGKVRKQGSLYSLADINTTKLKKPGTTTPQNALPLGTFVDGMAQ